MQTRVSLVDFTPVDFARARLVQFAAERAIETFRLLNLTLEARDVDVAELVDIAPQLFQEAIKMAQLFFYMTDRRMAAVELTRDLVGQLVDDFGFVLDLTNAYCGHGTSPRFSEPAQF